jgi:undecaprenyl diphosphate synthase
LSVLSLFAFSQENWQRPRVEIRALMSLLEEYIAREVNELRDRGVQVRVLGELDRLTPAAASAVERVVAETEHNDRLRLNLFISYSARAELVRAARLLAADVQSGALTPDQISDAEFQGKLYTFDCPDPDLLIRTSGEQRISNFLLWQMAYTEWFISPVLWPDFGRRDLFEAILDYQNRERRFGRVLA